MVRLLLLFRDDGENLHAVVIATLGTNSMGQLGFMAMGAFRHRHLWQFPLRAVYTFLRM